MWELEPDEMTERVLSIFTSLPVLIFKLLNAAAHKEERCEKHRHTDAPSCFPRCMKSSLFGNLKPPFVFFLQQAVQLFPNCGVGKKVNLNIKMHLKPDKLWRQALRVIL